MSGPTSRNRAGVKRRIVEIAETIDPNVQVTYGWPGDEVTDSGLYLEAPYGDGSIESMPGTLAEDRFTIPAVLVVMPFVDPAEAEEAAETWLRTFDAVLRRDMHRLKSKSGSIPDGNEADYAGIKTVSIGHSDGPASGPAQLDGDGTLAGAYLFDLACVSRLS